jgi:hypothetical protein
MGAEMLANLNPTTGPVEEVDEQAPVPVPVTTEQFKAAVTKFQNSFYFWPSGSSENEIDVMSDPFHIPYGHFSSALLRWKSAQTAAGKDLLDPKSNKDASFQKMADFSAPNVLLTSKATKSITKLYGMLRLRYPTSIVTAELPLNSINKEIKVGNAECKLLNVENNMAVVWSDEHSPPIDVYLLSRSGAVLHITSWVKGAYSFYKETIHGKKVPTAIIDKFVKAPDDLFKEGFARVYIAKGVIAKVVVVAPVTMAADSLSVMAYPVPQFGEECPLIPAPRYAAPTASLGFADYDEAKVKKETDVRPGRSDDNDQMIFIVPPRCANTYFADAKVKDLVLTKRSKPVAFDPQGPFRNDDGAGFHFRMDPAARF